WQDRDTARRPEIQLALATLVRSRKTDGASKGYESPVHGTLRQFCQQSGESRPNEDGDLGPAKLRRNDGLHVQRGLRHQNHDQTDARSFETDAMTKPRLLLSRWS